VIGLLASSLYLAAAGLVVVGGGQDRCPGATAVSSRLAQLLGDEPGAEAPDALVIDGASGALRVRLLSAQGVQREEKILELEGSCDELADAVATVAVAWRSRLQADDVPPPVLAAPIQQVYDREAPRPRPSAPVEPDLELRVGVGSVSGTERWAPALVLAAQAPLRNGFAMALTLNVPAPRSADDPLAGKSWRWVELSAVVAPSYRMVTENLLVDTQIGLGAGVNVTTTGSSSDNYHLVPPALVAEVRWTYRHVNVLPWFAATLSTRVLRTFDSPVPGAIISSEAWWLGLTVGATLAIDGR
jgi:hypothetical protein